jgi:ABC-type transporter Mla MlaB component
MAELNGHLSQPVFVKVWQQVAKQLNDFIFMQVVSRSLHRVPTPPPAPA